MRILFIVLIVFLCFSNLSFADEARSVDFILPEGHPFRQCGFKSAPEKAIMLRFGDAVRIVDEFILDELVWYRCSKGLHLFYLPEPYTNSSARKIVYDANRNIAVGSSFVDRRLTLPLFYKPDDLVAVPVEHRAEGYKWRNLLLRKEAALAFTRLIKDAERDGVVIRILSAYRDAEYQSYLYDNAIKKYGIFQNWVAKPGHSEHQLGTACDLTTDEIQSGLSRNFENTAAFYWLMEHSAYYGISLSYPKYKERLTGYHYEPWHFRYWGEGRWANYARRWSLFFTQ